MSLAPNRAHLQWLKDVLEAARHAKREAKRQEEEKGRRKPAQAANLKNPGDGVAVAHENAALEQTPERLAGTRPHWRKAQKGPGDRRRAGKRKGRKRLARAGNSAHKAKSYPARPGAQRRREPNENKTYFQASHAPPRDKTHARLNTQRKTLAVMLALWKRTEAYDPKKFLGAV